MIHRYENFGYTLFLQKYNAFNSNCYLLTEQLRKHLAICSTLTSMVQQSLTCNGRTPRNVLIYMSLIYVYSVSGPNITIAIWRCHKTLTQCWHSIHWKLRYHWLKGLRQRQIVPVIQGAGTSFTTMNFISLLTGHVITYICGELKLILITKTVREVKCTCLPEIWHIVNPI